VESSKVRQTFLDFFRSKGHVIVPSAPMVVKNDPTLMFNNSGMAPFKDLFLGNAPILHPRVADTQKCLRVSGKHNDLEEVGVDTYHHTMFEMLGNWSFGDYFKKEAIAWAWELLTEVYKIDPDKLYVTVFEGSAEEGLAFDQESYDTWKQFVPEDRILRGNKKDNFWEMGDTGPCGPCTEIHIDLRDAEERSLVSGASLVNNDHPQVIEVWNNVFMEFERKADGSLVKLPRQHVDTGMGFERLCMALQGKKSNYDTDVFQPLIRTVEVASGKKYGEIRETDVAMRVLADHVRTIAFAIADGQLPGNTKAGYVIRRILRRAVRYYYTFLDIQSPLLCRMVGILSDQMGSFFPELPAQRELIENVIREEEHAFLRTLGNGITRFEQHLDKVKGGKIAGDFAFELFDTYGFPIDLTELLAREKGVSVDMSVFQACLDEQKNRSRAAAQVDAGDWVILDSTTDFHFVGYHSLECKARVLRYRSVQAKGKTQVQIVLNATPFYAESGGQVGDRGVLNWPDETIAVLDTKKENGVTIHYVDRMPNKLGEFCVAMVDKELRISIARNHSATHLMHAALREVLGTHVEQKGSLVNSERLRFDFSHFSKVTEDELNAVERKVNEKIRSNIESMVQEMTLAEAQSRGAMALFGEKYGERVRVVTFDASFSVELCGGTHVERTGAIGQFRFVQESAVAAGIRRVEAITGDVAEQWLGAELRQLEEVRELMKRPKSVGQSILDLMDRSRVLEDQLAVYRKKEVEVVLGDLSSRFEHVGGLHVLVQKIGLTHADSVRDVCFGLRQKSGAACIIAAQIGEKITLSVVFNDDVVKTSGLHAGNVIKSLALLIGGGGGGQPFYASAGGTKPEGLDSAFAAFRLMMENLTIQKEP
jgi:alanyl-tRNA synthetase